MAQFAAESRRSESEAICGRLQRLRQSFDLDAVRIARDASPGPEAESFVVIDEIAAFRKPERLSPRSRHTPLSRDGRNGQYDLRKHRSRARGPAFWRTGSVFWQVSNDESGRQRDEVRPGEYRRTRGAGSALVSCRSSLNDDYATVFRNSFTEASRAPNGRMDCCLTKGGENSGSSLIAPLSAAYRPAESRLPLVGFTSFRML